MNIMIEIECDTLTDLPKHLEVLQEQIKKQVQVSRHDPQKEEFPIGTSLSDDNCYGTHKMDVIEVIN